tara:strand:- start:11550 stop:11900 length:351 start_codon:yes stop_codon:yes gene_type:complete
LENAQDILMKNLYVRFRVEFRDKLDQMESSLDEIKSNIDSALDMFDEHQEKIDDLLDVADEFLNLTFDKASRDKWDRDVPYLYREQLAKEKRMEARKEKIKNLAPKYDKEIKKVKK